MDPVSHAIVGRFLITLGPRGRAGAGVGVAAVLGALSPDLDAVLMPIAWDLYLRVHQIGTHTLVGAVACAMLVASVVRLFAYVAQAFRPAGARDSQWRWLVLAAWVGALSHVVLDVLSGATVRPWWPLSTATLRYGLVGMAEPSVVAMLVVAAFVFWRWPARRLNVAATCLVLLSVLFAGKATMREQALRMYETITVRDQVEARLIDAEWGAFSHWAVVDRTADRVRRWRIDTAGLTVTRELDMPRAVATGPIAIASQAAVAQNFLAAHDYPIVITTSDGDDSTVRWSDLQYCWTPTGPAAARPLIDSPVRPADLPIACGLWFAVVVNSQGTIAREFVTIGEWEQQR